MNLDDILFSVSNVVSNSLSKAQKSIQTNHLDKTDSVMYNFIEELKNSLDRYEAKHILSQFSQDTLFEIDRLEDNNYIVAYIDNRLVNIPKELCVFDNENYLQGKYLQLQDDGLYHIIDEK